MISYPKGSQYWKRFNRNSASETDSHFAGFLFDTNTIIQMKNDVRNLKKIFKSLFNKVRRLSNCL